MLIAVPFGFYGCGNIGDEATLKGFAALAAQSPHRLRAVFAAQDPDHTRRIEPAFSYFQYQGAIRGLAPSFWAHAARAYVFAGGTPIMDGLGDWPLTTIAPMIEHGKSWFKPSVFVGVGTEHLERAQSRAVFTERIAPNVAYWSVRAEADRARLIDLSVPPDRISVAADMAWLLSPASLDFGRAALAPQIASGRPLIGVNINAETKVLGQAPSMFADLATVLDSLVDAHDAQIVFLFNEVREDDTFDLAAARAVRGLMRRGESAVLTPNLYHSPHQMMSMIGCCALTISTRYHFCLFSALQGVPFMPIKRSDKVADLGSDLKWSYGAAPQETLRLADDARDLLATPEPAKARLEAAVMHMRQRAQLNQTALDALVREAASDRSLAWAGRVLHRGWARTAHLVARAP